MTELPKLIEKIIKNYLLYEVKSLFELSDLLKAGKRDKLTFIQYGTLHREFIFNSNKYLPLDQPVVLNYHFENVKGIIDISAGLVVGQDINDTLSLYNKDYQICRGKFRGQHYFFIVFQEIYGKSRYELACRVFYSDLAPSKNIYKPILPYNVRRFMFDYAREFYMHKYYYIASAVIGYVIGKGMTYGLDRIRGD